MDTERDYTPTMADFIAANRVTMTSEPTDHNPHMDDSGHMHHYRCTLRCGSRRMSLTFSMGSAHKGHPTLPDVLDCLARESYDVEGNSFETFAADMGYDADSRKALKTYNVIVRQMRALGRLLGPDAYSTLLYGTERL